MKVALLDLKQQNNALAHQLQQAFQRVLDSGQFILGREVEDLERALAALVDARYAVGVSSGTDAILLSRATMTKIRDEALSIIRA